MPPGVRSRLFLGIDQVQLAWRSILRERSAGASDGCFLASTHWRLDDARLAVRRGLSRVCVCVGGPQALGLSSPYRCFHLFASRVDVATFEAEAWARDHVIAKIVGARRLGQEINASGRAGVRSRLWSAARLVRPEGLPVTPAPRVPNPPPPVVPKRRPEPDVEVEVESRLRFGRGDQPKRARRQPEAGRAGLQGGRHPPSRFGGACASRVGWKRSRRVPLSYRNTRRIDEHRA
jgi:hypothetical protein